MVSTTLWGEHFELYAEHPVAAAGHSVSFLMHLTTLADFRPLDSGKLILELNGPETLRAESSTPLQPGIFSVKLSPQKTGVYTGQLSIEGATSGVVEGIELEVVASGSAVKTPQEDAHQDGIEFLKEQQWKVNFNTAFVERGTVLPSVIASGRVQTPPDGEAVIGPSVTGRLVSPAGGLPHPGSAVKKGQILATLIPTPSAPEQGSGAKFEVTAASERLNAADKALLRANRLYQDEAISARALEDARREVTVAQQAVHAAQSQAKLYSGASGSSKGGSWRLRSPIDGILVKVAAKPGATVSPGQTLFHVINPSVLWLVARVPEQDASRFRPDQNAAYKLPGDNRWVPITLDGEHPTATIVSVGRIVDPVARTVDVRYQLLAPDDSLRVGGLVQISLPTGEPYEGITIPRKALIEQDGRHYVYVQRDGEHFQERPIRIGSRAGGLVSVEDGIQEGERIVVEGAHLIRLADRSTNDTPH